MTRIWYNFSPPKPNSLLANHYFNSYLSLAKRELGLGGEKLYQILIISPSL